MPNWCGNTLLVSGDVELLDAFAAKVSDHEPTEEWGRTDLSLNKILPLAEDDVRASLVWGTKCDVTARLQRLTLAGEQVLRYDFDSAWSTPTPVILHASSEHPQLIFQLVYREQGMSFAGYECYEAGSLSIDVDLDSSCAVFAPILDANGSAIGSLNWSWPGDPVTWFPHPLPLAEGVKTTLKMALSHASRALALLPGDQLSDEEAQAHDLEVAAGPIPLSPVCLTAKAEFDVLVSDEEVVASWDDDLGGSWSYIQPQVTAGLTEWDPAGADAATLENAAVVATLLALGDSVVDGLDEVRTEVRRVLVDAAASGITGANVVTLLRALPDRLPALEDLPSVVLGSLTPVPATPAQAS